MRRLADALIDPIRVEVPADPEVLFDALVDSVSAWRGREVLVHRAAFPPHTASGLWLEREGHDDVVVDERAAVWHQIVIFCHEVWHMSRRETDAASTGRPLPVAARTDFSLVEEQEADRFGMLMGRRLRAWLETPADAVYAPEGGAGPADPQDLAGRIGAALNYRGAKR
ncbi:toxin [Streptomyces sp. NPDC047860]|uniref:toxin n=1 Tax=Streptomyces sp. NPDC047860 TaxID=3155743 RepID=UPI0033D9593B